MYASGFPAKKPLSLVSEFFDLIFVLNFVYASQFVFYVVVYTKTIRQLGLVVTLGDKDGDSVETINKSEVQVHETTNTEQNTEANEQTSQVSQSSSISSQSPNTSSTQGTNTHLQNTNTLTQNSSMQIPNVNTHLTQNQPTAVRSKLPKLILPKFKGDVTSYRSFWEMFESAVHKNASLTNIDKFNYLM